MFKPMLKEDSHRSPLTNDTSAFSIGTAFAIDGIEQYLRTSVGYSPETYAINIATLIRNRINSDRALSDRQIAELVKVEIEAIVYDLAGMMIDTKVHRPLIILYAIDYSRTYPSGLARPHTASRARLASVITFTQKILKPQISREAKLVRGVHVVVDIYNRTLPAHKHLSTVLRAHHSGDHVMMLSHVPLDYHIGTYFSNFRLVDSHTGNIRDYSELGTKVFKSRYRELVPFTPITYALLGDSDYVKSVLSIKQLTQVITIAKQNNWMLKGHTGIKLDVQKLGFLDILKSAGYGTTFSFD